MNEQDGWATANVSMLQEEELEYYPNHIICIVAQKMDQKVQRNVSAQIYAPQISTNGSS